MTLFSLYRALAFVVGVLLAFCTFVVAPLKYLFTEGTDPQRLGTDLGVLWAAHGFIFMIYVLVAFVLSRRADWSLPYTLVVLVAGTIPLAIFYVEHKVTQKVRAENPELLRPSPA